MLKSYFRKSFIISFLITLIFGLPIFISEAAPQTQTTRSLIPQTDSTFSIGTDLVRYLKAFFDNASSTQLTVTNLFIEGDIEMGGFDINNAGEITATHFTATSTIATSTFPLASTTEIAIGNFHFIGNELQSIKELQSTGWRSGGIISTSTANTFAIAEVELQFASTSPSFIIVTCPAVSNQAVPNISTQPVITITIKQDCTLTQRATPDFDKDNFRFDEVQLGNLVNDTVAGEIAVIEQEIELIFNVQTHLSALDSIIKIVNQSGNVYSASGSGFAIKRSAGVTYRPGIKGKTDATNPLLTNDVSLDPVTLLELFRDGSGGFVQNFGITDIQPDLFDDGSGILQTVNNNMWTVKTVKYFPTEGTSAELEVIYYGQETFISSAAAIAAAAVTGIEEIEATLEARPRSFIICRGGAGADLLEGTDCFFRQGNPFGGGSSGGSSAVTTLQGAYDNSTAVPEILTDATNEALDIQTGSGADTDANFRILNTAGDVTGLWRGDGLASTTDLIVSDSFRLRSLSGFLKATVGVIATALIDLTTDVTGILPNANGGTGVVALSDILGTSNQITISGGANTIIAGDATISLASPLTLPTGTTTATNLHVTGDLQIDGVFFAPVALTVAGDLDMAGFEILNGGQITGTHFTATLDTGTSTFAGGLTVDTSDFVVDPDGGLVGIGTSSPFANLSIDHQGGEIPFAIGSSTGQSLLLNANGNLVVDKLSVGTTVTGFRAALGIERGSPTVGLSGAVNEGMQIKVANSGTGNIRGVLVEVENNNSSSNTNAVQGFNSFIEYRGTGDHTGTDLIKAGRFETRINSSATIADIKGLELRAYNIESGTPTITDTKALHIQTSSIGSGTVINEYGILIEAVSNAINNFAIVTNGGDIIFNENGTDSNLRVEGDTDPNLLVTDGGTDRVGIGTSAPNSLFQVGNEGDSTDDYLQIDSEAGAPPNADCDSNDESGRMILDHTNDLLYICNQLSGNGWDNITLNI